LVNDAGAQVLFAFFWERILPVETSTIMYACVLFPEKHGVEQRNEKNNTFKKLKLTILEKILHKNAKTIKP
jgi:hypothetical protein